MNTEDLKCLVAEQNRASLIEHALESQRHIAHQAGRAVSTYHRSLIEGGMSEHTADVLAAQYAQQLWHRLLFTTPTGGDASHA